MLDRIFLVDTTELENSPLALHRYFSFPHRRACRTNTFCIAPLLQCPLALLIQILNKSWFYLFFLINPLRYASVWQMAALYEAEACCSPGRSVQTSSLCSMGMAKQNLFSTHLFNGVSFKNIKNKKCCRKLWILGQTSDFCNRESQPTSVWI